MPCNALCEPFCLFLTLSPTTGAAVLLHTSILCGSAFPTCTGRGGCWKRAKRAAAPQGALHHYAHLGVQALHGGLAAGDQVLLGTHGLARARQLGGQAVDRILNRTLAKP